MKFYQGNGEKMKGKLIKTRSDIQKIQKDTEMICLQFRPSIIDAFDIKKRTPRLKHIIFSSEAYLYTLGTKTINYFKQNNIEISKLNNRRVQKTNESRVLTDIVINMESE